MREYGGYIEIDKYSLPMLHGDAIELNCGRNCLAYLIQSYSIKKIVLPYFLCDSVKNLCIRYDVEVRYYHINDEFEPIDISLFDDEWLYIVNYYGQLDKEKILIFKEKYVRIILDNAQDYFQMPIKSIDTLYTCRKYFGVPDGAFLYTDSLIDEDLPLDESFDRMRFLFGRFERTASEFYSEYSANNRLFASEPIKKMSRLTDNLLHAINYDYVKKQRTDNFNLYFDIFRNINKLNLCRVEGAFAYPLFVKNGFEIRDKLQKLKIYIPMLWPNVMNDVEVDSLEYNMAKNILPLPCDQRYVTNDIEHIIQEVIKCID